MSPRQRIELGGYYGLAALLLAIDLVGALYLIQTPTGVFRSSPVWDGVLDVFGSMAPVGWGFAVVAAVTLLGLCGVPLAARVGLFLALAPWGAIVASFVTAWMQTGLGMLTAAMAAAVLILHLASVGHFPERKPHPSGR